VGRVENLACGIDDGVMTDFRFPDNIGSKDKSQTTGFGVGGGVRIVVRQALALVGLFLVILSIPIGFLTPFLPIGLPIGVLGSALLARNSVWGQQLIKGILERYPKLYRLTPSWLLKLITGSDHGPEHEA